VNSSINVISRKPPEPLYETSAAIFEFLQTNLTLETLSPDTETPQVITSPTFIEFMPLLKLRLVEVTLGVALGEGVGVALGEGVGVALGEGVGVGVGPIID
jgi:hypothetical protein